jgi:hypothetical protein
MGRALFPHSQWDRLESVWVSYYPPDEIEGGQRRILALLEKTMPGLAEIIAHHRPRALGGASLKEILQTHERGPARLAAHFQAWRAAPMKPYRASPTLVFAVIGQARADGLISPEEESRILADMLGYWALRDTLNYTTNCARPLRTRSSAHSFSFATT